MANNIIVKAPAFHGKDEHKSKIGSSAEDFLAQCENLQTTHAWTDVVAAGHAISYLNGAARTWFAEGLMRADPESRLVALTSFTAFCDLIREYFFDVASTYDLSVDWTGLRQKPGERVADFTFRVLGTMNRYVRLFTPPPQRAPRQVATERLIDDLCAEIPARNDGTHVLRDAADVRHRPLIVAQTEGHFADGVELGRNQIADDICLKLLSEGVSDTKMRELIRRRHKEGIAIRALIKLMTDLENAGSKREAPVAAVPKLMPIAAGSAALPPPTQQQQLPLSLNDAEIAAVLAARKSQGGRGGRRGGRGGRGGGSGRGGGGAPATGGQQPQHNRSAEETAAYYAKTCTYRSEEHTSELQSR